MIYFSAGLHSFVLVSLRLHRLVLPCLLFAIFFELTVLDPTEVGWLLKGDLGAHFIGWTAFQHDAWRWPIGFSELIAYPTGMPLTATDSNALMAVPLKLFSGLLPTYFQFIGAWYLLCLILSYNIVFNLLKYLSDRPLPSVFATIIVVAAPFLFWRSGHDTLMAHWLFLGALSTFLRTRSDRRALVKQSGLTAVSLAVHPYIFLMTISIASADILRRSYRRFEQNRSARIALSFLAMGSAVVLLPALLIGWILGIFTLQTTPQDYGIFTMDPFAWANGAGASASLTGWPVGPGQFEGFQFLGMGALIGVIVAMALWITGLSRPPQRLLQRLAWLLPSMFALLLLAVSPIVQVFGVTIASVDVSGWPLVGYVFETFRSSGRFGWPVSYLLMLVALSIWLAVRSRMVGPLLAVLAVVQIADQYPIMKRTKFLTQFREVQFRELRSQQEWRRLVDASDWIYVSEGNNTIVLFELGYLAFPAGKSVNRFYFAQGLATAKQVRAVDREREKLRQGQISGDVLYILDRSVIIDILRSSGLSSDRVGGLDGHIFIAPEGTAKLPAPVDFRPTPESMSLYDSVESCTTGCALLLSVRDEATASLSPELADLVQELGGNLHALPYRGSYAAIFVDGKVAWEALSESSDVTLNSPVFQNDVAIVSGGANGSNNASIKVNGLELSPNARGINMVRLEGGSVTDINAFDTHVDPDHQLVKLTREEDTSER